MRFKAALYAIFGSIMAGPIAHAGMFPDTPDLLICTVPPVNDQSGLKVVLYLDAVLDDGRRSYKALGTPALQATVSKDGRVETTLKDCNGKTIAELAQMGQTGDF